MAEALTFSVQEAEAAKQEIIRSQGRTLDEVITEIPQSCPSWIPHPVAKAIGRRVRVGDAVLESAKINLDNAIEGKPPSSYPRVSALVAKQLAELAA